MSRFNSYSNSSFMGNQSSVTQNKSQQQFGASALTGKLTCDIHPNQKIKAICLKEDCESAQRLVCFQCMTSIHTACSEFFVSTKEIKTIRPKEDVFQVYNYPTKLLDKESYSWIRNFQEKLQENEDEVDKFYNDLKEEIIKTLDEHRNHIVETIQQKKECVEKHVQNIKAKVNTSFSLQPLQNLISEISSGQLSHEKFNKEVTKFLTDEKKVACRDNIKSDVESMVNVFNYGFLRPSVEQVQGIKKELYDQIELLQSKILSPLEFVYKDGDVIYGNDSKFLFGREGAEKPVSFQYQLPEGLNLACKNSFRQRIRLQDLNEDPNVFSVNLGIFAKGDNGTQEDTGNYITLGHQISTKNKGEFDQKKWNNLSKKFKDGVLIDVEINFQKNQLLIFEVSKDFHPLLVFKQTEKFEEDREDWTLSLTAKPENKFSLDILESHLID